MGWFPDDISGGRLKKVMCILRMAESIKTYICCHSRVGRNPASRLVLDPT